MKKLSLLIAILLLASLIPMTAGAAIPPIDLHWTCDADDIFEELVSEETLKEKFIKDPANEKFSAVCAYRGKIFLLIEKGTGADRTVLGGIYRLAKGKAYREKKEHDFSVICEIQRESNALKINYLCYNPTVAAGSTKGEEFSFRVRGKKRRSYGRLCTVYFSGLEKKECEKWKRVK